MNRVVVGKLALDIDLLEGIKQLAQKEGVQTEIILSAVGALRRATSRNLRYQCTILSSIPLRRFGVEGK
jgi:predicted DNA-binding protein with PD1-like motif